MHFRPQNMLPGLWGWILAAGLGVIFGGCSPLPVASEKTSDDDSTLRINLKMEKHRLANGLTLILVEDHRLPIVAYHTLFRVGSINENRLNNGVSHFLEHMMFKKTKDLQDGEFTQFVEQAGGYFNATTYPDKTQYYERVPR
ncbi:MAG: insulinase family protein, partial [Bacteriovoracaceae bacterium]|nr:insulinase family protein [Bacteriovoracaceae bacterium]